jgi:hypothetical protein
MCLLANVSEKVSAETIKTHKEIAEEALALVEEAIALLDSVLADSIPVNDLNRIRAGDGALYTAKTYLDLVGIEDTYDR